MTNPTGTIEERRAALMAKTSGSINRTALGVLALQYGATLVSIGFPLNGLYFGRGRFRTRFAGPWVYSVVYITLDMPDLSRQAEMEEALASALLANLVIHFIYGSEP